MASTAPSPTVKPFPSPRPGHHRLYTRLAQEFTGDPLLTAQGDVGGPVKEQGQNSGGAKGHPAHHDGLPSNQDPGETYHGQGGYSDR